MSAERLTDDQWQAELDRHAALLEQMRTNLAACAILGSAHTQLLDEHTFWTFIKDLFTGRETRAWNTVGHAQEYLFRQFDKLQAQW